MQPSPQPQTRFFIAPPTFAGDPILLQSSEKILCKAVKAEHSKPMRVFYLRGLKIGYD